MENDGAKTSKRPRTELAPEHRFPYSLGMGEPFLRDGERVLMTMQRNVPI